VLVDREVTLPPSSAAPRGKGHCAACWRVPVSGFGRSSGRKLRFKRARKKNRDSTCCPRVTPNTDGYFEQESLTICTSVTFKLPCSLLLFFTPVSCAMSFVSSFKLWAVEFETAPVAVIVWPT
jgi:hypothetical protein